LASKPGVDFGKRGWAKTPFVTAGTTFDSTGALKRPYKWIKHLTANKYPYRKGDRAKAIPDG